MKNSTKKLGISIMLFAMLFGLVSTVHAMTVSEFQTDLKKRLEIIAKETVNIRQFDDVVIEGITSKEVGKKWYSEFKDNMVKNESRYFYVPKNPLEDLKANWERIKINERNCRNIISVMSDNSARSYIDVYGWPDSADFDVFAGYYVHTFFNIGDDNIWRIYRCKHSSKEGFDNHVYWIKQGRDTWDKIEELSKSNSNKEQEPIMTAQGEQYYKNKIEELKRLFKPYIEKGTIETQQYVANKTAEDNKFLLEIKEKLTGMSCEFVLGNKDVGVGNVKLFSKKVKCKSLKNCELRVGENDSHDVGIYCRCKHPLSNHVFKFKKGVNGDELVKKIYEHEVKM